MKYRLRYSYTTPNCHVYVCESRDPKKDGIKIWLPRFNMPNSPLVNCELMLSDNPINPSSKLHQRAKVVYKQSNNEE